MSKRALLSTVSIVLFSFLAGLILGLYLPNGLLKGRSSVVIYREGEPILGKSKYYEIVKIQTIPSNVDLEKLDVFYLVLARSTKCMYESVEINYLVLQDTTCKSAPDRAKYVFVDFLNPKANIVTTKKIALGEHLEGEYGSVSIEVPGIRVGLSEEEGTAWINSRINEKSGTLDDKKWKEFLGSIKPKLICRPTEEIQTIWLAK